MMCNNIKIFAYRLDNWFSTFSKYMDEINLPNILSTVFVYVLYLGKKLKDSTTFIIMFMESFDYDDYLLTLKKCVQLMPKLRERAMDLEVEELEALRKYFNYQHIINERMSKAINMILMNKVSTEKMKKSEKM
jgi:hypothetical protein